MNVRRFDCHGRELDASAPDSEWYWVRYEDVQTMLRQEAEMYRADQEAAEAAFHQRLP